METILIGVATTLLILTLLSILWLIIGAAGTRRDMAAQGVTLSLLQQQLENLRSAQDNTSETLHKSLQNSQTNLAHGLQTSQQTLNRLFTRLGELQGTSQQMLKVGHEVQQLQAILTSPKLRGQMGEWSLETLLANVLPRESYHLQYSFQDGKIVDALVVLSDFTVPIDAKFPLPAFQRILNAENEQDRLKHRRRFHKDVTIHIDKIAGAYIRPTEGTLDFALMYIPAENVYYETVVHYETDSTQLLQYSLDKKVIPVSPNLLYAYLMTVAMGLHGLRIEQQAAEIRQNLKKLSSNLQGFISSWETLGSHIRNAHGKYEDSQKHLNRFTLHLQQVIEEKPNASSA